MASSIAGRLTEVRERIHAAARSVGRNPESIRLIAVSKTFPLSSIREAYEAGLPGWLPSEADRSFVHSLMRQVVEPGKMAAWIAPPDRGINNLAVDYEYVRLS